MDIIKIRNCVIAAAAALADKKDEVDRLNVFPVPDGDTGTNMSLTMDSVVAELKELPDDCDARKLTKAIKHGSLMGARGNSGVITSQILRGICDGLPNHRSSNASGVAGCLEKAVEVAFQAVRKPIKGTILTVLEDSATAARNSCLRGEDVETCLRVVSDEAYASCMRTPEYLPVLKENGVVDSGGYGLTILIQAFVSAILGDEMSLPESINLGSDQAKVAIEQVNDWAGSKFHYCTEFLFHAKEVDVEEMLKYLSSMGDCELMVGAAPDFKVHVHTDEPGSVLTHMTETGEISQVFIHNMTLEANKRAEGIASESQKAEVEHKQLAVIAVAAGDGAAEILKSMGVDYVVSGGQTMNPSTKDLIDAIEKCNCDSAIILPNNSNIIMSANTAAENIDIQVEVIPTKSICAAFSAMVAFMPDVSLENNAKAMKDAIEGISVGEVTTAVKDSKTSAGQLIRPGDIIGIANGSLDFVGNSVFDITISLIEKLNDDSELVTLLAGKDFDDDSLDALTSKIEEQFDDIEVESYRGDQPLYPILFSIE